MRLIVHCKLKVDNPFLKRSKISFKKVKSIIVDTLREELSCFNLCTNMLSYDYEGLVKIVLELP